LPHYVTFNMLHGHTANIVTEMTVIVQFM